METLKMQDLDDRFTEAARMVVTTRQGNTSYLQRRLGMGYARAGRVMDELEAILADLIPDYQRVPRDTNLPANPANTAQSSSSDGDNPSSDQPGYSDSVNAMQEGSSFPKISRRSR